MSEIKSVGTFGAIAILMMFPLQMGMTVITPAMAVLADHWGMTVADAAYLSTLSTITTTIVSFFIGSLFGKKMKYRTAGILGSLVFLIGGVGPAFFDSYGLTLVFRAIMGVGIGIILPLGNALVIGHFDGDKQSKMLGYGTLLMNFGGLVFQTLGGQLVGMGWNYVFYGHLFGLVSLAMAFFIKEPEIHEVESGPKTKTPINKAVIVSGIVLFLFNIVNYPAMLNVSTIFLDRDIGGADLAAWALNIYTIIGCIGGLAFGTIFLKIRRFTLPLGFALSMVGVICVYVSEMFVLSSIGLGLIGFGFAMVLPSLNAWIGFASQPKAVAGGIGIAMALMNLGAFMSTYYLQAFQAISGDAVYQPLLFEIIILVILLVVFLVFNPFSDKYKAATDAE